MDEGLQDKFFNFIDREIKNNKISHAYLIETNDFDKIDLFLNILVKKLLCPSREYVSGCSLCNICHLVDSGSYPDLKIIDTDTAYIKKEQLMEVKESFRNSSVLGGKQIYVIKDASKLNSSSGNTMLKFLEEPSSNIIAILLTKSRYNVLETILSRCQVFSLEDDDTLVFDDSLYKLLNTLFVQNKGFLGYEDILAIMPDRSSAINYFNAMKNFFFKYIQEDSKDIKNYDDFSFLTDEKIYNIIFILEEYLQRMEFNVNYKIMLDEFLISLVEVVA